MPLYASIGKIHILIPKMQWFLFTTVFQTPPLQCCLITVHLTDRWVLAAKKTLRPSLMGKPSIGLPFRWRFPLQCVATWFAAVLGLGVWSSGSPNQLFPEPKASIISCWASVGICSHGLSYGWLLSALCYHPLPNICIKHALLWNLFEVFDARIRCQVRICASHSHPDIWNWASRLLFVASRFCTSK